MALELIDVLCARGIVVSIGHSNATAAEAHEAFDRGARTVTHLFNAMRPFGHRDPGIAGVALAREDVFVQLILDGHHVADEVAQMVWRAAAGSVALVTDAVAATGVGDGDYRLGIVDVEVRDGVARRADGVLAGSVSPCSRPSGTCTRSVRRFAEAVAAASSVPARVAGQRPRPAGAGCGRGRADPRRPARAPSGLRRRQGARGCLMAEIVIDRARKVFANGFVAVDDVSLTIADGEFMVLVGPSGCGKTSLLRLIAGLEEATSGRILIGDRDVTDLAPRKRDVAMVFQSYALYPHMSVRQNLGYGLKVRRTAKAEVRKRVEEVARMLRLDELLDRRPAQLSGGQRQRVAMGRAVIREPKAFLMDEPLSNLDAKLRVGMRAELSALHARLGTTTIYVTHDQVEAMTLGQRVAVMRDGRIQQVDTPQGLYRFPESLFVAAFIGSPAMNLVEAKLDGSTVEFAGFRFAVPIETEVPRDGRVILGIRPEGFEDAAFADPSLPVIEVEVAVLEELGSDTHAIFAARRAARGQR